MIIREVREEERNLFDLVVDHPLQAWSWGEFRKSMGGKVVRLGVFDGNKLISGYQLYSTPFPKTNKTIWLLLRGPLPDQPMLEALMSLLQEKNGIFVKLEPNVGGVVGQIENGHQQIAEFLLKNGCVIGKPFFATHTFWLDLTKSDDELLEKMKEKTRYNLRIASKHGVVVSSDNSSDTFEKHLELMFGTAKRQGFAAHTKDYHREMWRILNSEVNLKIYLLTAKYNSEILVTWVLFKFKDTLYYPYGASSVEHKDVMAGHAMMWEAIQLGKRLGCKKFDLWGAAAPGYTARDSWAGFTRFKEGFGGDWIQYTGSFDLVADRNWYGIYTLADRARVTLRKIGIHI